jgi:hypothetical protein
MTSFIRVKAVEPREQFIVHVRFTNDEERDIDIVPYIRGPVFEALRDPQFFAAVHVEGGTIAWPNGADIDPDVLFYGLPPAATESEVRVAIKHGDDSAS